MDIFLRDQPFEFGEATYKYGGLYGPITFEHMDLAFVLEGAIEVKTDEETHTFTAGQAAFVYSEKYFEVTFPKEQTHSIIWCHTGHIAIPNKSKALLKALPVRCTPSELLITLLKEGHKLGGGKSINLTRIRNSLGEAVFNEYFHLAQLKEEKSSLPKAIIKAKEYIRKNYSEACGLDEIANSAGLSSRYLIRLFNQHIGTTPIKYLWQLRSEEGVQLLLHTGLTISEIAYRSGFKSSQHFSRYVKEHYMYSPKDLREIKWKQDPSHFNKDIPHTQPG